MGRFVLCVAKLSRGLLCRGDIQPSVTVTETLTYVAAQSVAWDICVFLDMVTIWEKSRSSLNEHLALSVVSKTKNGNSKKTPESNSYHRNRTRTSTPPSSTKRPASLRSFAQRPTRT